MYRKCCKLVHACALYLFLNQALHSQRSLEQQAEPKEKKDQKRNTSSELLLNTLSFMISCKYVKGKFCV